MSDPGRLFVTAVLDPAPLVSLRQEAASLRPTAERDGQALHTLDQDGGLHGRYQSAVAGPGPSLRTFQKSLGLTLARALSGSTDLIYPTRCSYIYYEAGDYGLIHHDVTTATITVIVGLDGAIDPLVMYPDFGAVSDDDLRQLNRIGCRDRTGFELEARPYFGDRVRGFDVTFDPGHMVAIAGRSVAHSRFVQSRSATICAACYAHFRCPDRWMTPQLAACHKRENAH